MTLCASDVLSAEIGLEVTSLLVTSGLDHSGHIRRRSEGQIRHMQPLWPSERFLRPLEVLGKVLLV